MENLRIPTIPARDSNLKAATIPIEGGPIGPSACSWGHRAGEVSRPDRLAAIFRMLSPFNVSVHEAVEDGIGDAARIIETPG